MRASSSRVHASSIEKNISSRNELAHNRTIHSRGGLSLSPPPVIISSFLPASFIKRCLASCIGPVSPIRFAESFHAQYTNPIRNESTQSSVFESLKYHEIRAKPFREKSCRCTMSINKFPIHNFFQLHDPFIIFRIPSRRYFYIIRLSTKFTRRILNRAKEKKGSSQKDR